MIRIVSDTEASVRGWTMSGAGEIPAQHRQIVVIDYPIRYVVDPLAPLLVLWRNGY